VHASNQPAFSHSAAFLYWLAALQRRQETTHHQKAWQHYIDTIGRLLLALQACF
jgi:hypothetical protein